MRHASIFKILRAFLFLFCGLIQFALAENEKPNFILILTDDQPYGYLGVTGNSIVKTPHLDHLAREGMLFTNAHVSSAICTPSRVSILLSQYERKHGVNFNSGTSVSKSAWQNAYPVQMRKAGYFTGWVGKNHTPVGRNGYKSKIMEESFNYWYAGHGHLGFYPKARHSIFDGAKENTQIEIISEGVVDFLNVSTNTSNESRLKNAIKFLDDRPADRPFMLSINFNLPHGASTSTMKLKPEDDEIYRELYRDLPIPLPENYIAKKDIRSPKLPSSLLRVEDRQSGYDYVDNPDSTRERYIRQLQSMTGIDRLVGQLRNKLSELCLADNTIIIFTSDHGLFMGEYGLGGKALCYEKNTRVPLIIYNPISTHPKPESSKTKNPANPEDSFTNDALVQTIDIAPTMLSLANIKIPDSYQGENISRLLNSTLDTNRQYAFSENLWSTQFGNPRCEAIQNKNWKYIRYYKNNTFPASKKIKTAKQLGINVNQMLYATHDNDIAVYRDYIESPILGEKPVYEELYNIGEDPLESKNLVGLKKHQPKLEKFRSAWKESIKFARGDGDPEVVRYTADSQLENNNGVQLE